MWHFLLALGRSAHQSPFLLTRASKVSLTSAGNDGIADASTDVVASYFAGRRIFIRISGARLGSHQMPPSGLASWPPRLVAVLADGHPRLAELLIEGKAPRIDRVVRQTKRQNPCAASGDPA
jgi:hypothetical protein